MKETMKDGGMERTGEEREKEGGENKWRKPGEE